MTEKVSRLPENRRRSIKTGHRGRVVSVVYENKRKHKQWVLVELRGNAGNITGRFKLPSNWLRRV